MQYVLSFSIAPTNLSAPYWVLFLVVLATFLVVFVEFYQTLFHHRFTGGFPGFLRYPFRGFFTAIVAPFLNTFPVAVRGLGPLPSLSSDSGQRVCQRNFPARSGDSSYTSNGIYSSSLIIMLSATSIPLRSKMLFRLSVTQNLMALICDLFIGCHSSLYGSSLKG